MHAGRTGGERVKLCLVEEGRKRVLLIAAAILAARKLSQYGLIRMVPATVSAISDSVRWAERIMNEIDERWPTKENERTQPKRGQLMETYESLREIPNLGCHALKLIRNLFG